MNTNALGEKIKELRLSRKMSQVDLSKGLSVANSTISNWENGRRLPSINELKRIADYFGVSLNTFDFARAANTTYETAVRLEYNQTIDFRPIGFATTSEPRILFVISSSLVIMSSFISPLSFILLIVGMAGVIWSMLILLSQTIKLKETVYKRVLIPVTDNVFYEHALSPNICLEKKKQMETLSTFLIVSDIVLMYMVFVESVRIGNLVFNIALAALAVLVIAFGLFRSQAFSKSALFEPTVPYYGMKKNLVYLSIVVSMLVESFNLAWLSTFIAIQTTTSEAIISPLVISCVAGINAVAGYETYIRYQAHLSQYTLKSKTGTGKVVNLDELTDQQDIH